MKVKQFSRSQTAVMLTILLLTMLACLGPATSTPVLPENPTQPGTPGSGWLEIYFSDPTAAHAGSFEGGPDEVLAAAIDGARLSVDVAAYSLNLWSIRNALVDAHARGVVVRMVMESDNMDGEEVQDLLMAGIEVLGDRREGLMHNKFVVIDRSEVWLGSMNYTTNGAYEDNNNILRVRSVQVAEDYTTEFNEMFVEDLFGTDDRAATPNPRVTIDGTQVEVYFSPDDGVANRLDELIQGARKSIYFMAYSFTSNALGEAIMERAQAGVTVVGIMDDGQAASNMGTEYDAFMLAGLDVWLDGNQGLMHHKVIIIDESIVVTGSYNFTANAEENNDENVVILHDAAIAAIFMEEFQRVYDQTLQP